MLWDESDDSLILPDSTSLKFGDSGDLTISHNASHSLITDSGQGQLKIQASQLHVQSADGGTTGARFRTGAEVELYHNGSQKFETTSGGIDVTGSVTTSGGIELGHASDTTISRSASGTVQIEGNTILTNANADLGATTTSSGDADHVLVDDGGVLKKITPANLGIGGCGSGISIGKSIAMAMVFG